jgi:hypothetical protein
MGQLADRGQDDDSVADVGGTGQGLWLESCSQCGRPLTIIATVAPAHPLCDECRSPN